MNMTYEQAIKFRADAMLDYWTSTPTHKHLSEHLNSMHVREGFQMQVALLEAIDAGSVSIWGPDKLAIHPPHTYNWDLIQAGMKRCNACGRTELDEVYRFSFAGRCCKNCLPIMREKHEQPGWDE